MQADERLHRRKNKSKRAKPCGTPRVEVLREEILLLILKHCARLLRHNLSQERELDDKLKWDNLVSSTEWLTVSKALRRSKGSPHHPSPLKTSLNSFKEEAARVSCRMVGSEAELPCSTTTFSITLDMTGSILIGK